MPNQQKYNPISFRPPEGDRSWLIGYASATSRPVNAILAEALAEYRQRHEQVNAVEACRRCEAPASCSEFGRCPFDYPTETSRTEES